jgi:zinc transport system substrate-binding protein
MARYFFVFMWCCVVPFLSCTKKTTVPENKSEKELSVTVSIVPQAYIVKRIAGEDVKVNVMVPSNVSPETYEPGPKRMVDIKESSVYFSIGLPFEETFLKRSQDQFPSLKVSKMDKNIPLRSFEEKDHDHSDHDCDGKHHHQHSGHDPHLWMDPVILISLAQNTLTEMLKLDNKNRDMYIKNHLELKRELQSLNDDVVDLLGDFKGFSFLVNHPAWGYFADRYGLRQIAIEIEGKEPSASEMVEMVKLIKEKKVKKIFIQKQFSESAVDSIVEETGISTVLLDPLEENVIESIRKSAAEIKEGLVK